jgi:hypothetical protein
MFSPNQLKFRHSPLLLALAGIGFGGCSLQLETDPLLDNGCVANVDCASGDACVDSAVLGRGVCVATESELGQVVLEVKRTDRGSASYVFADVLTVNEESSTGLVKTIELRLPKDLPVVGKLLADEGVSGDGCVASDGSVPVEVTLHRRFETGPFRSEVTSLSSIVAEGDGTTAAFALSVPAGNYDAYLVPSKIDGCPAMPPRLVPVVVSEPEIPGDPGLVLEPADDLSSALQGTLTVPVDVAMEGWTLELVDPTYGHVISESFELVTPPPGESTLKIGGEDGIAYNHVEGAILRLRDASGGLSVHWSVAALDLNSDRVVDIDIRDLVAVPEPVEATVIDSTGAIVPNAQVTLQSLSLTGTANQNASFRVATQSDPEGIVRVALVPGTYSVSIVPNESEPGVAAFIGEWTIAQNLGGTGKGFELTAKTTVAGTIQNRLGEDLGAAPMLFGPRQTLVANYFSQAFQVDGQVTRFATTTTGLLGDFEATLDPGTVDVAVQMPADSGFPWLVLPSLVVPPAAQTAAVDLKTLEMPSPVLVQGVVRDADGNPVSLSLVEAYVPGAEVGAPLIQVGSSATDGSGAFILPLPSRITVAP